MTPQKQIDRSFQNEKNPKYSLLKNRDSLLSDKNPLKTSISVSKNKNSILTTKKLVLSDNIESSQVRNSILSKQSKIISKLNSLTGNGHIHLKHLKCKSPEEVIDFKKNPKEDKYLDVLKLK